MSAPPRERSNPAVSDRAASTPPSATAHDTAALDIDAARKLDGRIRLMSESVAGSVTTLLALIAEAQQGRIHRVLGFASWPAYLADALSRLRLAVNAIERRELVAVMADEGMSNRAIAQAVGVTEITVRRDRQVRHDVAPEPVSLVAPLVDAAHAEAAAVIEASRQLPVITGIDGKTYTRPEPKPPTPRRRRPITDAFSEQVRKATQVARTLERLSDDDRFGRNAEALSYSRSDIVRTRDALNRVLAKLDGNNPGAAVNW